MIDGITDFHGDLEVTVPPFAALVVQPKDKKEVQTLPESPTLSRLVERMLALYAFLTERERFPPAGPHPRPRLARICHAVGLGQQYRDLSYSL